MKLLIKEGPNSGQELDLEAAAVVGRDPEGASLVIDDPEASRRHASLTPSGSNVMVEDLGSTNGTFVNGQRVEGTQSCAAGDIIKIGTTVLEVQSTIEATRMSPIPESAPPASEPDPDATAFATPIPGASAPPEPVAPPPAPEPFAAEPPAPEPAYSEPPAPEPAPAPFGAPPPPAGGPPPAGAGQGYGAPDQGYQQPAYEQPAYGQPPPGGGYGQPGGPMVPGGYGAASPLKTREAVTEWLLCYFVPLYSLFWFHRANAEMQQWSGGRIDYNAGSSLVALTLGWFIIVPPFVAWASFQGRIRAAQQMAGLPPTASFWGSVGRMFLLGYGYKWHQDQFNEIAVRQPQG
jgi:hypothetical protein